MSSPYVLKTHTDLSITASPKRPRTGTFSGLDTNPLYTNKKKHFFIFHFHVPKCRCAI